METFAASGELGKDNLIESILLRDASGVRAIAETSQPTINMGLHDPTAKDSMHELQATLAYMCLQSDKMRLHSFAM